MTLWLRVAAPCLCLLAVCATALAQSPEGWDRYLDRYRGPYRGQVIDADTKAPLAGAVFVALWRRDRVYPFHIVTENYSVRETVSDPDGRFFLDARDVEDGAPRRTRRPEFLIFVPGYGSFPRSQRSPTGFLGGALEGAGTTVELPRLEGRETRRKHLLTFGPHSFSENPFRDLPQLMRALNQERIAIGLNPYSPPEME
jgi:hypothetical protein